MWTPTFSTLSELWPRMTLGETKPPPSFFYSMSSFYVAETIMTVKIFRKHDGVDRDLGKFDEHIKQLHEKAESLPAEAREHPDIRERLDTTLKRKSELEALAQLRRQRLDFIVLSISHVLIFKVCYSKIRK